MCVYIYIYIYIYTYICVGVVKPSPASRPSTRKRSCPPRGDDAVQGAPEGGPPTPFEVLL